MSDVDVSVVLTARDQTVVCGPSVTSVDRAVVAAEAAGHTVEKVLALDHPDERTSAYFDPVDFASWSRWVGDATDRGRLHGAVAARARGRYLTFVRGGDLLSENWLTRALPVLELARDRGERLIGHPEVAIDFDGETGLHHYVDQGSELFTPYLLYAGGAFDDLCLAPRDAYLDLGDDADDAGFTVASAARGWRHAVVRETVVFRRRPDGAHASRSLPRLGIDEVRALAVGADQ